MAEKETVANFEARLARLEASVAQVLQRPGGTIADPAPFPGPVADPAPWPWPHPIADPAPFPWYQYPRPHPVADPAPFPYQQFQYPRRVKIPPQVGDPAPIDVSRFTRVQLESALHSIAAERIRLDGMEEMINKRLEGMQEAG